MKKQLKQNEKDLTRRYLVWCYKTTKESLDKIDRYFTQLRVDRFVLGHLTRGAEPQSTKASGDYRRQVNDFKKYMAQKEGNALKQKFVDGHQKQLRADYMVLKNRFGAVENAIVTFLGKGELRKICRLYEEEMTQRILQARDHR
jgi:hypothetical protein